MTSALPPAAPAAPRTDAEAVLYRTLEAAGVSFRLWDHPPTATVAAGEALRAGVPGIHTKSLLTIDKAGALFLITAPGQMRVDLKAAGKALGAEGRLSFASEEAMLAALGVRPGSVTPLALLNDKDQQVAGVLLAEALFEGELLWCHPLRNDASVGLSPGHLADFLTAHHRTPIRAAIAKPA